MRPLLARNIGPALASPLPAQTPRPEAAAYKDGADGTAMRMKVRGAVAWEPCGVGADVRAGPQSAWKPEALWHGSRSTWCLCRVALKPNGMGAKLWRKSRGTCAVHDEACDDVEAARHGHMALEPEKGGMEAIES